MSSMPSAVFNRKTSSTLHVILGQMKSSRLYFISHFAYFFVFRELLRSQSNLSDHKPEICINVKVANWKTNDNCKKDPMFAAAGPKVGFEQLEQVKIEPSDKTLNMSKVRNENSAMTSVNSYTYFYC